MKTRNLIPVSGLIAALALPLCVHAAASHRCAEQVDDAQRLACYDAAFGKPVRPAGASTANTPVLSSSPVPSPSAPLSPAAPAPAAAAQPVSFTAKVTALRSTANGRFVATLDNSQVWAQLEPDSTIQISVGDVITVKPGFAQSHFLLTPVGNRTRVSRVK
jgi:hypothetical protein